MRSTEKFQKFHCRTFGDRLYWIRTFKGFTLEEFGSLVGCHKSYLSRLESGTVKEPSETFLNRLCSQVWVDRDWLITGEGEPFGRGSLVMFGRGGKPSDERLGRVMALLEDTYAVLEPEAVLATLLQNVPGEEIYAAWTSLRSGEAGNFAKYAFWGNALMVVLTRRAEAVKSAGLGEAKPDKAAGGSCQGKAGMHATITEGEAEKRSFNRPKSAR